jgi:two-component system, OmpR family, KDP operon response regulator KdpE
VQLLTSSRPSEVPLAHKSNGKTSRVALLSNRCWKTEDMNRAGISTVLPPADVRQHVLASVPDAVVLEAPADVRRVDELWEAFAVARFPVLVVATHASPAEVAGWFERGAEEVITGEAEAELLAAHLSAILRRPSRAGNPMKSSVLKLGSITVDLGQRTVSRPEGTQSLSPTEFAILQLLLRAGGKACTHGELVNRVWGQDVRSGADYLRLYIRYIRHKIEEDPSHPKHILNVRGLGYRFVFSDF